MKKLLSAVIVVGVILAALPIVNGILMQRVVNNSFANFNEMYKETGTGYSLDIVSYKRGLYSSTIDWRINLGKFKAVYGIDGIEFTDNAKHGFTGVVSLTDLEKNEWFKKFIDENLQGKNPLSLQTSYSLLGAIKGTYAIAPFSFSVEQETINVSPGEIVVVTDKNFKKFVYTGEWEGFGVKDKLKFGKMSMEMDADLVSTFLWDGDGSMTLDSFTLSEDGVDVGINNLVVNFNQKVDMDTDNMSNLSSFSVESMTIPSTTVKGAKGTFALNNMGAVAYEEFMKQYMQVISELFDAGVMENPEAMEQKMAIVGMQMMAAYEKMLTKDLEMEIKDFEIKLDEGDIKVDGTFKLLKDITFMQLAPIMGQPSLVLDLLYLKTDLSLPSSLVGGFPMLFSPLFPGMQTGIFVIEGEQAKHKAETKAGELFVNNSAVDLNQLQQMQ